MFPFFQAVIQENWDLAESLQSEIIKLEKEADGMKRDLRLHLRTGLFLPVERSYLLELLAAQDRIANKAEDIAELIVGRKMIIPKFLVPALTAFLERSLDAAKQACKAINELDQLLESGFRGSEVRIVEEMILTLDAIEHEDGELLSDMRRRIFDIEKDMNAIEVVFLYKLVQWIGDLADLAQIVGSRLQILIAR